MHKTDPELVTVAEVEVGITELLQLLLCWGLERWAELAAAAAALATAEACTTLEVKAAAVAGAMDEVRAERCEGITFFMFFFKLIHILPPMPSTSLVKHRWGHGVQCETRIKFQKPVMQPHFYILRYSV